MPRRAADNKLRERLEATFKAAVQEADRVGYISAEEDERQVDELMTRLEKQAAAGIIKP